MKLRSLHGEIEFSVQKFHSKSAANYQSYFNFTGQFEQDYVSEGLKEYSTWLSCGNSYSRVENILFRHNGKALLSDQKIEQIVIRKAEQISKEEASLTEPMAVEKLLIEVETAVNIYDSAQQEVIFYEDGILVKGQKGVRVSKKLKIAPMDIAPMDIAPVVKKRVWHQTDICMLELKDKTYQYLMGGINAENLPNQSLRNVCIRAINKEYKDEKKPLSIISITDGATSIRNDLMSIFGVKIVRILDWYHLKKKNKDLMSMIAVNKEDKQNHLNYIQKHCWEGKVDKVITYLKTKVITKNQIKLDELIGYLEKHQSEIINYKLRKQNGKCIGSGRMECGVNQVIGKRQKNNGTAWSEKGSKALAILKVQILNNNWDNCWNIKNAA